MSSTLSYSAAALPSLIIRSGFLRKEFEVTLHFVGWSSMSRASALIMIPARLYRYAAFLIVIVFVALPFLYRFGNFPADSSLRKWSFPKEILASSFSRNTTNPYHSNFQIDVVQANYTENPPPEKLIHVPPGVVSLEPTHVARVVYDGDTWLFECQAACKETIVPPHHSQAHLCRR